ncbi:transmembrane protein, putative [Medicago truncatula]|uniref:Transmembrane protein, putative n=1 Tax=Medicago truncatula TaxID=3880 RepID=A0A072TFT4_MEDTR|nr:transmembrane protein, putative [Medicago truncatula]
MTNFDSPKEHSILTILIYPPSLVTLGAGLIHKTQIKRTLVFTESILGKTKIGIVLTAGIGKATTSAFPGYKSNILTKPS